MAPSPTNITDEINLTAKGVLICRPAGWKDIFLFLALNYAAHAFTIVSDPWESSLTFVVRGIITIYVPAIGLSSACRRIYSGICMYLQAFTRPGDSGPTTESQTEAIRTAHYAGVLCTLAIGRINDNTGMVDLIAPQTLIDALKVDKNTAVRNQYTFGVHRIRARMNTRPEAFVSRMIHRITQINIHGRPEVGATFNHISQAPDNNNPHTKYVVVPVRLPSARHSPEAWDVSFGIDRTYTGSPMNHQMQREQLGEHKTDGEITEVEPRSQGLPIGTTGGLATEQAMSDQSAGAKEESVVTIAQKQDFLQAAVAMVQGLYSIYGIYEARRKELGRYGFASFHFSVLPFAMMSLVNLVAMMILPQYDAVFLVKYDLSQSYGWHPTESDISYTERLNRLMPGAVGTFQLKPHHSSKAFDPSNPPTNIVHTSLMGFNADTTSITTVKDKKIFRKIQIWSVYDICFVILLTSFNALPIIINYILTGFDGKTSTKWQKIFMITWLVIPTASVTIVQIERLFLTSRRVEKGVEAKSQENYVTKNLKSYHSRICSEWRRVYPGLGIRWDNSQILAVFNLSIFTIGVYMIIFPILISAFLAGSFLLLSFGIGGYYTVITMIKEFGICEKV